MSKHLFVIATGIALLTLGSTPATADWLVLETGEELETQGGWQVDGRRVIYTSLRGTLSSVRLSGVDVDASRALTQRKISEAQAPPAEPTEVEVREPVLVLTDADFSSPGAEQAPPVEGGGDAGEGDGVATDAVTAGAREVPASDGLENRLARQLAGSAAIEVLNWSVRPTGGGQVSILGYMRNSSQQVATAVGLTVVLVDSDDIVIESVEAQLSTSALMPGIQAFFEARFSDTVAFASVEFTSRSIDLEVLDPGDEVDAPEA